MKVCKFIGVLVLIFILSCGGPTAVSTSEQEEVLPLCSATAVPAMAQVMRGDRPRRLAVATSDFQSGELVFGIFDSFRGDPVGGWSNFKISADAIVRSPWGSDFIFVLNRQGAERAGSVEVFSKRQNKRTANYSVGGATNPQDIVVYGDAAAYVSRLGSRDLIRLNALDGTDRCRIDFSAEEFSDADGLPEMSRMLAVNENELWVALQRLDSRQRQFTPSDKSLIAVVDVKSNAIRREFTVTLAGRNPVSELKMGPRGQVYVATQWGPPGSRYGGIEAIDPVTHRSQGFILRGADFESDIWDFDFVSDRVGVAVIANGAGKMKALSFDVVTGKVGEILLESEPGIFSIAGVWFADGVLFVGVRDQHATLKRFDVNLQPLPPLDVRLPPFSVSFAD